MSDSSSSNQSSQSTAIMDAEAQATTTQDQLVESQLQTLTSPVQVSSVLHTPPPIPSLFDMQQLQQDNASLSEVVETLREELEKRISTIVDEDSTIKSEDKETKKETISEGLKLVTEALREAISAEMIKEEAKRLADSVDPSADTEIQTAKEDVLKKISDIESTLKSINTTYADSFFEQPTKITSERIKNLQTKKETDLKQQLEALNNAVWALQGLLDAALKASQPDYGNWDALGQLLQGSSSWDTLGALIQSSDNWDALGPMLGFEQSATDATKAEIADNWSMIQSLLGFSDSLSTPTVPTPTPTPTPALDVILLLVGEYENHLYDKGGKNDWHYVTISQDPTNTNQLKWTNRAGVSWTLTPTADKEILTVGQDCPYYKDGHTQATVQWSNGQVTGLLGPGNELYERSQSTGDGTSIPDIIPLLVGAYENHLYDQGGKNNWHYVAISQDPTNPNQLKWTNRAGVSWTLTPTADQEILTVGQDCPYYKNGHTQATVQWSNGQVTGLLGPGNELYDRSTSSGGTSTPEIIPLLVGEYENHLYDQGGKNNWHYVAISQDPTNPNQLKWTNRAGVSWTLTPTANKEILTVGQDCPYYSRGHTQATVKWSNGQVTGLLGPGNELYDRSTSSGGTSTPEIIPLLVGEYENHLYDQGGKNNWHYVTIGQDPTNPNQLKWTNRAGVSWTLTPTTDKEILTVGKDCPYYSKGHTQATVKWNNGQVTGLLGPGNELYDKSIPG